MKRDHGLFVRTLLAAGLLGVLLLLQSCLGSNPTAPPAPPLEIPMPLVLKFVEPASLNLGVDGLGPLASPSLAKAVGDNRAAEINTGFEYRRENDTEIIEPLLRGIGEVEVPATVATTQYRVTKTFSRSEGFLTGTKQVKIDFADFDFDNDGSPEGCSGNSTSFANQTDYDRADPANVRPICARMWVDGVRYLAWVFDQPYVDPAIAPVEAVNIGSGRFKGWQPVAPTLSLSVAFSYDQRDLENAFTEEHLLYEVLDNGALLESSNAHSRMMQQGPEGSSIARLDLNVARDQRPSGGELRELRYLGQYVLTSFSEKRTADLWSGSLENANDFGSLMPFTDECVRIFDGIAVDPALCEDVDVNGDGVSIRVFDAPFIEPFAADALSVPNDFPDAPTF